MTLDGLVERNVTTGAEVRISNRVQEFNLREQQPHSYEIPDKKGNAVRNHQFTQQQQQLSYPPQSEHLHKQPLEYSFPPQSEYLHKQPLEYSFPQQSEHADRQTPKRLTEQQGAFHQGSQVLQTVDVSESTPQSKQNGYINAEGLPKVQVHVEQPAVSQQHSIQRYESISNATFTDVPQQQNNGNFSRKFIPREKGNHQSVRASEHSGALKFPQNAGESEPIAKPNQSNMKYYQRFNPEAAQPDKATVMDNPLISESGKSTETSVLGANLGQSIKPELQHNKPSKLQFFKNIFHSDKQSDKVFVKDVQSDKLQFAKAPMVKGSTEHPTLEKFKPSSKKYRHSLNFEKAATSEKVVASERQHAPDNVQSLDKADKTPIYNTKFRQSKATYRQHLNKNTTAPKEQYDNVSQTKEATTSDTPLYATQTDKYSKLIFAPIKSSKWYPLPDQQQSHIEKTPKKSLREKKTQLKHSTDEKSQGKVLLEEKPRHKVSLEKSPQRNVSAEKNSQSNISPEEKPRYKVFTEENPQRNDSPEEKSPYKVSAEENSGIAERAKKDVTRNTQNKVPPKKSDTKPPKLKFTRDEKATDSNAKNDKKMSESAKLDLLKDKADKANAKLEKARNKLASKRRVRKKRASGGAKKKGARKLRFEDESFVPKPQGVFKKGAYILKNRSANLLTGNNIHQEPDDTDDENVGISATHTVGKEAEKVYQGGKKVTHSAFRFVRNSPYRKVAKLEKKAAKANFRYAYKKALSENPKLKSNMLSRFMQKQKIKRQYAKRFREAKRAGQNIKRTVNLTQKSIKFIAGIIKRNPGMVATVVGLLVFILLMSSFMASCSTMLGGGLSSIIGTSYLAEDIDIDNAELAYSEWETDLQMQISSAEENYPGYDEYRYSTGNIGHNPYELMAYLTAVYYDFAFDDIQDDLMGIFNQQYSLSFEQEIEVRYRKVVRTDPVSGNRYEVDEPYDWHVLNVMLQSRSFTDVIYSKMDVEEKDLFNEYMQSKGNRQYLSSPFDFNWIPYITSYYGYRVHPTTGVKDNHMGIDIGVPIGTDIHAGHNGTVTFAGDIGNYGYVVVIDDGKGLISKYAHCDQLLVSEGQVINAGDIIAKSGNTGNSTAHASMGESILHLEIIKDGQYLNPIYFTENNDDGNIPIYGQPGTPMGDGSYGALIAEAELHLGKPYIFGANGPDAFDCSSYICYIFTKSGVKNLPRTTAQAIYNQCTPIPASEAKPGDLIFFHSTYSTSDTVTHIGLYVGGNRMVHAGSPVQYTSIDTEYWRTHFLNFGRLN